MWAAYSTIRANSTLIHLREFGLSKNFAKNMYIYINKKRGKKPNQNNGNNMNYRVFMNRKKLEASTQQNKCLKFVCSKLKI